MNVLLDIKRGINRGPRRIVWRKEDITENN
jgi:hypothetical protein